MYVKVYRHKIKKNALPKWKKAAYGSAKIYKKSGDKGKWIIATKIAIEDFE